MAHGRTFTEESQRIPDAAVTLVHGTSFVICAESGDIRDDTPTSGVFVADTRICSRLEVTIDGVAPEPLATATDEPYQGRFISRTHDRGVLLERRLRVGRGVRLDLCARNLEPSRRSLVLGVAFAADLADIFAVKEGRADGRPRPCSVTPQGLVIGGPGRRRGLLVHLGEGAVAHHDGTVTWELDLAAHDRREVCLDVAAVRDGDIVEPLFRCDSPADRTLPAEHTAGWRQLAPTIRSDIPGLVATGQRSIEDLGALRIHDPAHPDEPLVAAGAPWFMTLFGRDSILTSMMALPLDPSLGLGTARALARLQGTETVAETDEEPGRILHEVRHGTGSSISLEHGQIYYGTADATPLFVMLVHELWRWGTPLEQLVGLLPAVDAALGWMAGPGDGDGDGYVEYQPAGPASLRNQGWKDSFDGISFRDGSLPQGPIALAEVQGYAYAAWLGGAALAAATGRRDLAAERAGRARELQERFRRDFWMADVGAVALGLDGDKRQIDAVASNMGHCLWTGIVDDHAQAASVARWLSSEEMFSGWGIRTLATTMGHYNPLSYHNGSVWPHDTAICVAGLRRAGFAEEAALVGRGLLRAADALGGRLPELFAGLSAAEFPTPVPYPASCSPQAWASAAPLLLLRATLGLEPDIPSGVVHVEAAPQGLDGSFVVAGLALAGTRVSVAVDGSVVVEGLPPGVELAHGGPRGIDAPRGRHRRHP